ncbi:MAG: N-acetylneuraminate synthase [Cellvibrionaceae bacterium]
MKPITIIAEAGVNHNGDEKLAFDLVDAAAEAGADIVKFQTFKAKELVTQSAQKAEYQKNNTNNGETQFSMLQKLELPYEMHFKLLEHCVKKGIEFLSTAFDLSSLEFLTNKLGLKKLKIPSGEITNAPLVLAHARTGCDLILSTGMATLAEIEAILGVVAFGYITKADESPNITAFQKAYASVEGQRALKEKVTLLHCTTEYPAPLEEINLASMNTMTSAFGLTVGYSDHSEGITVPVAAAARGATLIEKHFTLDKTMEGPDHKASLEPNELKNMIQAIRDVEKIIGNGIKGPQLSEVKNKEIARKSLVSLKTIEEGDIFTVNNLGVKRPGSGINPFQYWDILGQQSHCDYKKDELIK